VSRFLRLRLDFGTVTIDPETLDEMFTKSQRGAIIVGAALIDNELRRLIETKLTPWTDPKRKDPLFDADARPLSSFSAKINLAVRLSLIDDKLARLLDRFRELRNDYAHKTKGAGTSFRDKAEALATEIFGLTKFNADGFTIIGNCRGAVADFLLLRPLPNEVAIRVMIVALYSQLRREPDTAGCGGLSVSCEVKEDESVVLRLLNIADDILPRKV
jgi:hypothetical protein